MVALAADEILMEPYSVLGPVDPQVGGWPAGALIHLAEKKPAESIGDQVLILAEIARLSLVSVQRFILWLLADKLPQQLAAQTAEFLTGGYLSHDTPSCWTRREPWGCPAVLRSRRGFMSCSKHAPLVRRSAPAWLSMMAGHRVRYRWALLRCR